MNNPSSHNAEAVVYGPITYAHLADLIGKMSDEQRECHLSIYDSMNDEFYPVSAMCIVQEAISDGPGPGVLDENHPYLEI